MALKPPAFVDCYGDLASRLDRNMAPMVAGLEVFRSAPRDEDDLIGRLRGRRNVLVYMSYMSRRVLRACPDLRTIAYLSTGLSTHGDLAEAARLGIRFEGVKGYGDRAVAEHAIALAFAALKSICAMDREVRADRWRLMRSEEFAGKTFGVIGLGGIGSETAKIAAALGARTIGWSRSMQAGGAAIEMMPLDDVLAQADILSLHLALTPETAGMFGKAAFARMKRGVVLINTARAGIVDEDALIEAVTSGQVGHAGLDVFHTEPLPRDHPLAGLPNVTLTPHSAWLTTQSADRLLTAGLGLLARHIEES